MRRLLAGTFVAAGLAAGCPGGPDPTEPDGTVDCYYDGDGDGWGYVTPQPDADGDCSGPLQTDRPGDCDDSRAEFNPDADDVPSDGFDQDCDGVDAAVCFVDSDLDGWGGDTIVVAEDGNCAAEGLAGSGGDCADLDVARHPGAEDIPDDGVDQDCTGADATTCYYDGDGDGHGWPGTFVDPDGTCGDDDHDAPVGDDCDDSRAAIHPGADEVADDGIDQDCNGADARTCWVDADGDDYGSGVPVVSDDGTCDAPGISAAAGDCDDTAFATHPFASEVAADGIDQDCDGVDAAVCYYDGDGDGYGWPGTFVDPDGSCLDSAHDSPVGSDCDDGDATIYPGAPTVLGDGFDQDCDGVAE